MSSSKTVVLVTTVLSLLLSWSFFMFHLSSSSSRNDQVSVGILNVSLSQCVDRDRERTLVLESQEERVRDLESKLADLYKNLSTQVPPPPQPVTASKATHILECWPEEALSLEALEALEPLLEDRRKRLVLYRLVRASTTQVLGVRGSTQRGSQGEAHQGQVLLLGDDADGRSGGQGSPAPPPPPPPPPPSSSSPIRRRGEERLFAECLVEYEEGSWQARASNRLADLGRTAAATNESGVMFLPGFPWGLGSGLNGIARVLQNYIYTEKAVPLCVSFPVHSWSYWDHEKCEPSPEGLGSECYFLRMPACHGLVPPSRMPQICSASDYRCVGGFPPWVALQGPTAVPFADTLLAFQDQDRQPPEGMDAEIDGGPARKENEVAVGGEEQKKQGGGGGGGGEGRGAGDERKKGVGQVKESERDGGGALGKAALAEVLEAASTEAVDTLASRGFLLDWLVRPRPQVWKEIVSKVEELRLPPLYLGLHARQGDKSLEVPVIGPAKYFEAVCVLANRYQIFDVFLATDSDAFLNIITAMNATVEWTKFSPCFAKLQWYFNTKVARHAAMQAQKMIPEGSSKWHNVVDVLVDIHVLRESTYFIGTLSSNLGRTVGTLRILDGASPILSLDDTLYPQM